MPLIDRPQADQARVLQKSLEDLLSMERLWRQRAEKEADAFRRLLERLAYQMGGGQLVEDARRANPQAFQHWTAEDWEQIFHAIALRGRGWEESPSHSTPTPQLKKLTAVPVKEPPPQLKKLTAAVEKPQHWQQPPARKAPRRKKKSVTAAPTALDTTPALAPASIDQMAADLKEVDWQRISVPDMYKSLVKAGGMRWLRGMAVLYLIAKFGVNSRVEIAMTLSAAFAKSLATTRTWVRRAGGFLVERGLLTTATLRLQVFPTSLSVYKLTQDGRYFAQRMGWKVVESEWERAERLHEGARFPAHTMGILAFALHARLRGWTAFVLPEKQQNATPPDVLIQKGAERWFVEVELSQKENAAKWRHNAEDNGGKVALVAATPDRRHVLVADCKRLKLPGVATDLQTLVETRLSEIDANTPLWIEVW